jgi:hypothetical protein
MSFEVINPKTIRDFLDIGTQYGSQIEKRRFPLTRILSMIEASEHKCKTILVENDYEDDEYVAEYDMFYKQVFFCDPKAKCKKLHFFSSMFTKDEFEKAQDKTLQESAKSYLGYCTIRPEPYKTISDALVSQKLAIDSATRFVFFTCLAHKKFKLCNVELEVCGFPYLQQDGRIAVCAQAALSIISQYFFLNKKIEKAYSAPAVTQTVSRSPNAQGQRHLPSNGLNIIQIRLAMEEMGFNPMAYDFSLTRQEELMLTVHPEQIIYRFIESGIPVIIGINTASQGHALVVVGHTFNPDYWWSQVETLYYGIPKSGPYHLSTNWIQNFIVQDDNLGPYLFVPSSILRGNTTNCIIAPLSKLVFNAGDEAEKIAFDAISQDVMREMMKTHCKVKAKDFPLNVYWLGAMIVAMENQQLVLRTYLSKKDDFLDSLSPDTNKEVMACYKAMELPDSLWVVELSTPPIFCYARLKLGEVLIDPTSDPRFDTCFLSIHVPGIIFERNKSKGLIYKEISTEDPPSKHLYRHLK